MWCPGVRCSQAFNRVFKSIELKAEKVVRDVTAILNAISHRLRSKPEEMSWQKKQEEEAQQETAHPSQPTRPSPPAPTHPPQPARPSAPAPAW